MSGQSDVVARAGPSANASAAQVPGEFGAIVGEIITDLVRFAVAHALGKSSAKADLAAARMRLDELHSRVNPQRERGKP